MPAMNKVHHAPRFCRTSFTGVPSGGAMKLGRTRIMTDIVRMVISKMGLSATAGMVAAAIEPITPPNRFGTSIGSIAGTSSILCWLKPRTPTTHCSATATRLVALATSAGKPSNMSTGSVRLDPPPAIVFIPPAITPTAARMKSKVTSYSMGLRVQMAGEA